MPIVSTEQFLATKFDYVIVGGGTAGLALAVRLSEDPKITVGVLEAGDYHENAPEVNVPGMMGRALTNPSFDWAFVTQPEKYVNDRVILQSRGKGLGGSSLLNFLAFVRPAKDELDALERLGNPGWNWNSTLEYMKKSEHLEIPELTAEQANIYSAKPDPVLHGTDGPIAKSFPPHVTDLHAAILDTLEGLGIPRNSENSGGYPVGSLLIPTTVETKTATRSYAASAYYKPNAERPNLFVILGAHATKIQSEKSTDGLLRATAVDFIKDGKAQTIAASKEIILSAGAFQTPQLLELSGIGDSRVLKSFGIEPKIDLPGVGANLQDHALTPTIVEVDNKVDSVEIMFNPEGLAQQQELYKQQKGILAGIPSSCFAFLPAKVLGDEETIKKWLSSSNIESSPADVFADVHPTVKKGITKQYEIMREWIDSADHPLAQLLNINGHMHLPGMTINPDKRYTTLLVAYTHPFARGSVHITSTDPLAPPSIVQNYLSNPADLEILTQTLKFVNKLYGAEPLADWVRARVLPPFEVGEDTEEVKLEEYVKSSLMTVHHPLGTAAMLPREDGGVVDSELKVYGTTNLRIVDCSVIPLQLSSNIQTVAYAIGEKAADIIKATL